MSVLQGELTILPGIIVTSLSDTESEASSSRTASPPPSRDFSQPGSQGFTLSPSFLTHLLATQRHSLKRPLHQQGVEKGLVLYRPIGIQLPHVDPEIVEHWPGSHNDDSSRFEVLDADESATTGEQESADMDIDAEEPMVLD